MEETKFDFQNFEKKKKAIGLIHKVYLIQLKNSRKYLSSTKTKSEVRGGGKKPWRQKGTGQARAGSNRSPLWVGGGVIFGPKPRVVNKKINKKERKLAILSALYLKRQSFSFFEDNLFENIEEIKTKKILDYLSNMKEEKNKKILFILSKPNKNFWLMTRNIGNIETTTANCLNLRSILKANSIYLSKNSLNFINKKYGKSSS